MSTSELAERWRTPEGERLAAEVIGRLVAGRLLNDLGLGQVEGRVDLREFVGYVPTHRATDPDSGRIRLVNGNEPSFEGVRLEGLDLSGALLERASFVGGSIADCRLDRLRGQSLYLCGTEVRDSSFVGADLRELSAGARLEGRSSRFERVDFSRADLRGYTSFGTSTLVDCDFSAARLTKVEFHGTTFIRCRFAGTLSGVRFLGESIPGLGERPQYDPHRLVDVDLSRTKLRWVEFKGLDLTRVTLPDDADLVRVRGYRRVVERALAELKGVDSQDPRARVLGGELHAARSYGGPHGDLGVINRRDLLEFDGEADVDRALAWLRDIERQCAGS